MIRNYSIYKTIHQVDGWARLVEECYGQLDIDFQDRTFLVHVVVGEDGLQLFGVVVGHLMPELVVPDDVWDLQMQLVVLGKYVQLLYQLVLEGEVDQL